MFQTIQLCRAVAAALVVLFHTGQTLAKDKYFGAVASELERLFWFGGEAGVAFFFVLSGFIITYIHAADFNHPERLFSYVRKRATRIYPTYWVIFTAVLLAAVSAPSLRGNLPPDVATFIKALLLLPQDKAVLGGTGAPVLDVAWSLQYELVFYAAFGVAIVSFRAFCIVAIAFFVNLLMQWGAAPAVFPWSFLSSHLILLFVMGMLAAVAVRSKLRMFNAGWACLIFGAGFFAAGAVATLFRDQGRTVLIDLSYGAISALLIFALTRYEAGRKTAIDSPLGSLLGDSSYALYLLHFPLVSVLCKLAVLTLPIHAGSALLAFAVIVVICISAGAVFNLLIEKPLLQALTPRRAATLSSVNL